MPHRLHRISLYCATCKSTTVWVLSGDKYVCVGDDLKHPERRLHGCGHEIKVSELDHYKGEASAEGF